METKNIAKKVVGVYDSYSNSNISALEGIYESSGRGKISLKRFLEFPDEFPDVDVLVINPDIETVRTQRGKIEKITAEGNKKKIPIYFLDPQSNLRKGEKLKLEGVKYIDFSKEGFDKDYYSLFYL